MKLCPHMIRPRTRLRGGGIADLGGFDSPLLRTLAWLARRTANSRWAIVKPKRASHALLWRGEAYYWSVKGYYRKARGDRRPLQHLLWEERRGKPIARGMEIWFKDRDRHNFTWANLQLLSKSEVHRRCMANGEVPKRTYEFSSQIRGLWSTRKSRESVSALLNHHQQKDSHDSNANDATDFLAQRRALNDRETARLYRRAA